MLVELVGVIDLVWLWTERMRAREDIGLADTLNLSKSEMTRFRELSCRLDIRIRPLESARAGG